MFVKRVGAIKPRDAIPYFTEHPDVWEALRDGKEVEIPDDVFDTYPGLEKVTRKAKKEKFEIETKEGEE